MFLILSRSVALFDVALLWKFCKSWWLCTNRSVPLISFKVVSTNLLLLFHIVWLFLIITLMPSHPFGNENLQVTCNPLPSQLLFKYWIEIMMGTCHTMNCSVCSELSLDQL